jgi:hypothetical protein
MAGTIRFTLCSNQMSAVNVNVDDLRTGARDLGHIPCTGKNAVITKLLQTRRAGVQASGSSGVVRAVSAVTNNKAILEMVIHVASGDAGLPLLGFRENRHLSASKGGSGLVGATP